MNYKRAFGFGVILWVIIFVVVSILMFTPWVKDSQLRFQVVGWVLEIPIVLLMAKWYFKKDAPTIKKGFLLGLVGIVVGNILDIFITIPLFIGSYAVVYGNWKMYIGYAILLILAIFAGWEFDGTYSSREEENK
jgi:hypothetical protein